MEWLQSLVGQVEQFGVPLFMGAYLVATLLPLPTWPLTVAAGVLFGPVRGVAIIAAVSLLGSVAAFGLSRYALRGPVRRAIDRRPRIRAVDRALRDGGWKAVALLQLSPLMPFGMQNYFLGASRVAWIPYLVGTVIGTLPSSAVYVLAGASGRRIAALDGPAKWSLLAVGVIATLALTAWVGRLAKRRLNSGSDPDLAG
jgi:uncharacterized membrane protein YdjX (TVP38/TMEM64 family)